MTLAVARQGRAGSTAATCTVAYIAPDRRRRYRAGFS